MSAWIPVCDFPAQADLSELAWFIQRQRLPLRIVESGNAQQLLSLEPSLVEPMRALMVRWRAGEVQLAQMALQMEQQQASANTDQEHPAGQQADAADARVVQSRSPIPSWPWRQTPLSLVLIALCFIGWIMFRQGWAEVLMIYPQRSGTFDLAGSTLAQHWLHGEYWRLWTPAIVHFSLPHALFNALGVWILGRPLEARAGTLVFSGLVLTAAAVSNLSQYYWMPQTAFGGMSGVVYALVGAVAVLQRWQPQWIDVPKGLVWVFTLFLLVYASGVVDYFINGGIANAAHLGGFVCGIVLAFIYCLLSGAKKFSREG